MCCIVKCCLVFAAACLAVPSGARRVTAQEKTPVITWPEPGPIVYGTPLGSGQLNARADVAGEFSYTPGPGTILPAGTHSLFASFQPGVSGYVEALVSVRLNVEPAVLTVRAEDRTRVYRERNPAFTYRFTGFRNREPATVLLRAPTCTTTATTASRPGKYPITCTGAKARNYTFTYIPGTLTVTRPPRRERSQGP